MISAKEGPHAVDATRGLKPKETEISFRTFVPGVGWAVNAELDTGMAGRAAGCGRVAAGCGRVAAAPAPAGLPCQNSNNSNQPTKKYRLIPVPSAPNFYTDREKKHVWDKQDDDTLHRLGMPTGAEARSAFHLRLNVAAFIQHWGRDRCLFFTVTDEQNLHPTQFARRWNSFLVRNGSWIVSFIRVLEPQKQGRPHYHLLVAVSWDTKPDAFDWQAFDGCQQERRANGPTALFRELRARYKASAAPELVAMWQLLRKVLPRYGLGRAELLPIRKGKEAISEYIGKYLEAGLIIRKHSWKGCRRVEFDRRNKTGWLACTRIFAWHSPGAVAWRARVGEIGRALDVTDMEGIRRKLGSKWAYHLRESIALATPEQWSELLSILAVACVTVGPRFVKRWPDVKSGAFAGTDRSLGNASRMTTPLNQNNFTVPVTSTAS